MRRDHLFLDLYLKILILGALAWRRISSFTEAPASVGLPRLSLSPSMVASTRSATTLLPGSPSIWRVRIMLSASTLNCLPLNSMIAIMFSPLAAENAQRFGGEG